MNIIRRIPFWLPPVVAVVVMGLYSILAGGSESAGNPVIMLSLLIVFVAMAVITPLLFVIRRNTNFPYRIPVSLASFCALILFGFFMLGGSRETHVGGLLPLFEYRFPLSGWIVDMLVTLAGLENIAYHSLAYTVIILTGLFIEITIVSTIIYLIWAQISGIR